MSTPYRLGVDLGTTWTAAAVQRGDHVEALTLGTHGAGIPSVLAVEGDALVVGEQAERVLAADPARGVREAKRRLGDSTPMVVGGTPYGAEALLGALLAHVVAVATEREGRAPSSVTLTHPATWGDYKLDLLREAGRLAGLSAVELCSEPQAAARHYAGLHRIRPGDVVAVYDFGGGTFDVALVACTASGAELLGSPDGLDRLGGIDLDQIVVAHVDAALDGRLRELDAADPDVRRGLARLRSDCTAAKEALSTDSEATVAIALPGLATEVRITREELEAALRPRIVDTLRSLDRALSAAALGADDLAGVLLVGGSSRIPLVAEEVGRHTGRPTLLDADPKLVVALGAVGGAVAMPTKDDATPEVPDRPSPPPPPPAGAAGADRKPPVVAPLRTPAKDAREKAKGERGAIGGAAVAAGLGVAAAGAAGAAVLGTQVLGDDSATLEEGLLADDLVVPEESLDAFDDALPMGDPGGGGGGGGGGSRGGGGGGGGGGGRDGGGRRRSRERDDDGPDGRVRAPDHDGPGGRPVDPTDPLGGASPIEFDDARATLQERLDAWVPPEGADPEKVAEMRAELEGLLERYEPRPGQSREDALADLRQQFDDQVEDFVQDLKLDAITDELREDDEPVPGSDASPQPGVPTRDGYVWEEAETLADGTVVPGHWERERAGQAANPPANPPVGDPASAPGGGVVTTPTVRDHRGEDGPRWMPPPDRDTPSREGATVRDHRGEAPAGPQAEPGAEVPSPPSQGGKPVRPPEANPPAAEVEDAPADPADAGPKGFGDVADVFDELVEAASSPAAAEDPTGATEPAAAATAPAAGEDPLEAEAFPDVLGTAPSPADVESLEAQVEGLHEDALGIGVDDILGAPAPVTPADPAPALDPIDDLVPELDPAFDAPVAEDEPIDLPEVDVPDVEPALPPAPEPATPTPVSGLDDDDPLTP